MVAAGSQKCKVAFVPTKFVSVTQSSRFVEIWMRPFKPGEASAVKFKPLLANGCAALKPSFKLNVLLETTVKLLVAD